MLWLPLAFSFSEIWNKISNFFSEKIYGIIDTMPDSPFVNFTLPAGIVNILGYVNWFVPVGAILATLAAWVACIGIYYLISAILRLFKVVGD